MSHQREERVRLLAEIDQQLKDFESLAADESATAEVRAFALEQLRLGRMATESIEKELSDLKQGPPPDSEPVE